MEMKKLLKEVFVPPARAPGYDQSKTIKARIERLEVEREMDAAARRVIEGRLTYLQSQVDILRRGDTP